MRLLASCVDNGSLKEIVCNVGTDTSKKTGIQPLSVTTSLAEGLKASIDTACRCGQDRILIGRSNGTLEMVEITPVAKEEGTETQSADFQVSKFEVLNSVAGLLNDSILEPLYEKSKKRVKLKDAFVTISELPGLKNSYFVVTRSGLVSIAKWDITERKIDIINTLKVKAPLDFAQLYDLDQAVDAKDFVFAYGGEENLVKLVQLKRDFSSLSQIWEAKNVKNDKLDLRVPVWPVALKFLKPYESGNVDNSKLNYQFVVVTHWSHLGLYRTQHGRKPLVYKELSAHKEPLSHLQLVGSRVSPQGNAAVNEFEDFELVTSDTKHNVYQFTTKGKLRRKYGKSDITGATSFLGIHNQKYLLQGGLDRYVRVFDLELGTRVAKVYLGSKTTFMYVLDDSQIGVADSQSSVGGKRKHKEENESEQEANNDKLWEELDITEKSTKKLKK